MTKVLVCQCENVHQDMIHGQKRRVHNLTKQGKGGSTKGQSMWRCTEGDHMSLLEQYKRLIKFMTNIELDHEYCVQTKLLGKPNNNFASEKVALIQEEYKCR